MAAAADGLTMRILLCDGDAALETALLQEGHAVRRFTTPRGAKALVGGWAARRAAAAFKPNCVMGGATAAEVAGDIAARHIPAPVNTDFLLDRGLPPEFRGAGPLLLANPLAGEPLIVPDIAVLTTIGPIASLMAGGCAIVAPDGTALENGITGLLYPPGDTAESTALAVALTTDTALRNRIGRAARAAFVARHLAARVALREAVGE